MLKGNIENTKIIHWNMIDDIICILGVVRAYFIPDESSLGPSYTETGLTMAEARKVCEGENADLAQITTKTEIEAAKYFRSRKGNWYFGI